MSDREQGGLAPLRFRAEEDLLAEPGDRVVHRPGCPRAPAGCRAVRAGEVIVRACAPVACQACWPATTMLLGERPAGR